MTKKNSKTSKKKEQEIIDVFKDPANSNEEGEKEMENNVVDKIVKEEELNAFRVEISDMLNGVFGPFIDENKITQKKIDNLIDKLVVTIKEELLVNPIKTLLFCIKSITNLQKDLPSKSETLTIEEVNEAIEDNYEKLLKDMKKLMSSGINKINKVEDIKTELKEEEKEEPKVKPKEEKPLSGFAYFLAQQKK